VYQKQNYKTIIKSNLTVAATAASSSKEALVHAEIAMSEWKQCVGCWSLNRAFISLGLSPSWRVIASIMVLLIKRLGVLVCYIALCLEL
jgi:hypothetical protein